MFKDSGNKVTILGLEVPKDIFLLLEPSYEKPPEGFIRTYNPGKVHQLSNPTTGESFCLSSRWAEGDRYMKRVDDFARYMKHEKIRDKETLDIIKKVS